MIFFGGGGDSLLLQNRLNLLILWLAHSAVFPLAVSSIPTEFPLSPEEWAIHYGFCQECTPEARPMGLSSAQLSQCPRLGKCMLNRQNPRSTTAHSLAEYRKKRMQCTKRRPAKTQDRLGLAPFHHHALLGAASDL